MNSRRPWRLHDSRFSVGCSRMSSFKRNCQRRRSESHLRQWPAAKVIHFHQFEARCKKIHAGSDAQSRAQNRDPVKPGLHAIASLSHLGRTTTCAGPMGSHPPVPPATRVGLWFQSNHVCAPAVSCARMHASLAGALVHGAVNRRPHCPCSCPCRPARTRC